MATAKTKETQKVEKEAQRAERAAQKASLAQIKSVEKSIIAAVKEHNKLTKKLKGCSKALALLSSDQGTVKYLVSVTDEKRSIKFPAV